MSRINSGVTAFAIMLSLGFAAMDAAPALANAGRTQLSPRAMVQRHVAAWRTGPNLHFARTAGAASCDLPSSGCPDNERITN
jgi:hypothetical protein